MEAEDLEDMDIPAIELPIVRQLQTWLNDVIPALVLLGHNIFHTKPLIDVISVVVPNFTNLASPLLALISFSPAPSPPRHGGFAPEAARTDSSA